MTLTTKILLAMVLGVVSGSILNLVFSSNILSEAYVLELRGFLVDGILDAIGKVFVASLKLLVVPALTAVPRLMQPSVKRVE